MITQSQPGNAEEKQTAAKTEKQRSFKGGVHVLLTALYILYVRYIFLYLYIYIMYVFRVVDIHLEKCYDLEVLLFSLNASNGRITELSQS